MKNQPLPQTIYHDRLSDASEQLEAMAHTHAFNVFMNDHPLERSSYAAFEEGTIVRMRGEALPQEMAETQFLIGLIDITALKADLIEIPAPETKEPDEEKEDIWNLTITYKIDDKPVTMVTTKEHTMVTTTNINGDPLTFRYPASMGGRFLLSMINASLDETMDDLNPNIPDSAYTETKSISNALSILGRLMGISRTKLTKAINHPDVPDRTLIVSLQENETLKASGIGVDYYLASEFVPDQITAMISSQSEIMRGGTLQNRYGKRFFGNSNGPHLIQAIQIGLLDEPEDSFFINPNVNRVQYDLVSSSVMAILERVLKPYNVNVMQYSSKDAAIPENP